MARSLKSIEVEGLFGMFDHLIELKTEDRITILTAPNGFGKTVVLRLTDAFFQGAYYEFGRTNFRSFTLEFDDGARIVFVKEGHGQGQLFEDSEKPESETTDSIQIHMYLDLPREERRDWRVNFGRIGTLSIIERYVPQLDRVAANRWRDLRTGRVLSTDDVLAIYGDVLPNLKAKEPDWVSEFRKSMECRFIETQRLLRIPTPNLPRRARDADESFRPAVDELAVHLSTAIKATLTEYATLSQSLDSTFPQRLIARLGRKQQTEQQLRERLGKLDAERRRLMGAGLLDQQEAPIRLTEQKIESSILDVLSVYVEDTEQKLEIFGDLFRRIATLTRIVNERFQYKNIYVEREKGVAIRLFDGTDLPLNGLSSGEQHELVLIYELLFLARPGSTILIDEPELSLHVDWQTQFIGDLQSIIDLRNFTAIIATHSPQIIDERWDLTVTLRGPKVKN